MNFVVTMFASGIGAIVGFMIFAWNYPPEAFKKLPDDQSRRVIASALGLMSVLIVAPWFFVFGLRWF